jgi:hypothetical protein
MPFTKLLSAALFAAALAAAPICAAQTTGTITGNVIDKTTKKPVADMIIVLTGTSLESEEIAHSGNDGGYRFANLQPGLFTVSVVNDGYNPYERRDLAVNAGQTYRLRIELVPNPSADK